jgi:hypothetical protein
MSAECRFFEDNLRNMPKVAEVFRRDYCGNQFSECARFIVAKALGNREVPSAMFPNEKEKALLMVKASAPEPKAEEIKTAAEK